MNHAHLLTHVVPMTPVACAMCFVAFAIPEAMDRARRADHDEFFCPNGDSNRYADDSRRNATPQPSDTTANDR